MCFKKSFASHPKSKYWSGKNNIKPRNVALNSCAYKCIFVCENGHEFITTPNSINNMKSWCPNCYLKTENVVLSFLKEKYEKVKNQYKVEWCKNKKCLPFDYFLSKFNLIIEVDGRQHFRQVPKWESPGIIQERDKYKMKCALKHGISIIRINQEDIYYNKYDWKEKLTKYIKLYTKKNIIYISSDNCYDCFDNFIPCKEQP